MNQKKDHKILDSQISKAKRSVENQLTMTSQKGSVFSGFNVRALAHLLKPWKWHEGAFKAKKFMQPAKKDLSEKCYDAQDLHLYHLREIMHEKLREMPKRKVWSVKLPKASFDRLYRHDSLSSASISHHTVISYPFEDEDELNWEATKRQQPDRPYTLTRIAEIYPVD